MEIKFQFRVEDAVCYCIGDLPYTIHKMRIISETEKTYLLENGFYKGKRMFKNANNRYAFDTEKDALKSYLKRKKFQELCLLDRLERVKVIIKSLTESEVYNG
jgi:hypothetical protein